MKTHLKNILIGALGLMVGLVAGRAVGALLFVAEVAENLLYGLNLQSVVNIILAFTVALALAGAIGGVFVGLGLSMINKKHGRWRFIWASSLSFGLATGVLMTVLVLLLAMAAFYTPPSELESKIVPVFGAIGLIFGILIGLILGPLTVGWKFGWVVLASAVGFGLGALLAGFGFKDMLLHAALNASIAPREFKLITWGALFWGLGGGTLGFVYGWLAQKAIKEEANPPKPHPRWVKFLEWGLLALLVIVVGYGVFRVWTVLQPRSAPLKQVVSTGTVGTHWFSPAVVTNAADTISSPSIAAAGDGHTVVAWLQDAGQGSDVFYAFNQEAWSSPLNVSDNPAATAGSPQLVLDAAGAAHLIWLETAGETQLLYSHCQNATCTTPISISDNTGAGCVKDAAGSVAPQGEPALAIDAGGMLLAVWPVDSGQLLYNTWSTEETPSSTGADCVPTDGPEAAEPRLAGLTDNGFGLVYEQAGQIQQQLYQAGTWSDMPAPVGQGFAPEIAVGPDSQLYLAWCGADDTLHFRQGDKAEESIAFPGCMGRPGLALDSNDRPHLVWYAGQVQDAVGNITTDSLLYESLRYEQGWTEPVIVAQTALPVAPTVTHDNVGTLHLVWNDTDAADEVLNYSSQVQYACNPDDLSPLNQEILSIIDQERYHPSDEPVPYCLNRYDAFVMSPNPSPPLQAKGAKKTDNGPFDHLADLAKSTEYELMFGMMFYDGSDAQDSPGDVFAKSVVDLYHQLEEDPDRYPRGLTVRILLGNPPEPFGFELGNQAWHVINDLREAGLPEMVNEELGWKVEVANFSGAWPHSHTKFFIVDGKTVAVFGFNYQYVHLPKIHFSGKGNERVDPGLQFTGPIAQSTVGIFNNMWQGATLYHCENLSPPLGQWDLWCDTTIAPPAEHMPEVQRYFIPTDDTSDVFSLYRTKKHNLSDEVLPVILASAEEKIDIFQINFTLDLVCDFSFLVGDFCTMEHALPFLPAMIQAVENGAKVRIMIYYDAIQRLENEVALRVMERELERLGFSDSVEVRYYNDGDMHSKTFSVDDKFLVIGSQNFHYSAWGEKSGLAEYNLGTDNLDAIADYQDVFEYHWQRAVPRR